MNFILSNTIQERINLIESDEDQHCDEDYELYDKWLHGEPFCSDSELFTEFTCVVMNQIAAHMNITQNKELIERIVELADKKATGTPLQLSDSLGISERNLYTILDCIKDSGTTITYSRTRQSYILE